MTAKSFAFVTISNETAWDVGFRNAALIEWNEAEELRRRLRWLEMSMPERVKSWMRMHRVWPPESCECEE